MKKKESVVSWSMEHYFYGEEAGIGPGGTFFKIVDADDRFELNLIEQDGRVYSDPEFDFGWSRS